MTEELGIDIHPVQLISSLRALMALVLGLSLPATVKLTASETFGAACGTSPPKAMPTTARGQVNFSPTGRALPQGIAPKGGLDEGTL